MTRPPPSSPLFPYTTLSRSKAREAAALNHKVPKLAPPPFTPLPQTPPVLPTGYADIAQKMLFDKSRNPTVVVDVPKVTPPRSEEHTSELQSQSNLVCRLLLE